MKHFPENANPELPGLMNFSKLVPLFIVRPGTPFLSAEGAAIFLENEMVDSKQLIRCDIILFLENQMSP